MVNLVVVLRVLTIGLFFPFANSARCTRSSNSITCENADNGVIQRLAINYQNDVSLVVRNSSVPVLESGMFAKLKLLEKFHFARCGVRIVQAGAFRGTKITHLNLAGNSIELFSDKIFADLPELKFLDLSHNAILDINLMTGVGYSTKLRHVDVSNNRLKDMNLVGNFSELETINFENNSLTQLQTDLILHLPKVKGVFFGGNNFNESYERFLTFVLKSCKLEINFENSIVDDDWKMQKISINSTKAQSNSTLLPKRNNIENDFKLSPELIRSLSPSELTNLVQRILTLRNFTLNERNMLEKDRKLIREESKSVKEELTRIDQLIKRYEEVSREAKQESIGEYIEESCEGMPAGTWWQRFKRWKCKKLFNWVKRLIY